jgi:hypothetical protein
VELLIARNPDPESRLPYLMLLPLDAGMVFRTSGTWPRTSALYCYPVPADEWPESPDIVERAGLRSCVRRGAAIDLVLDRGRENRSQIVFTRARGRDAVFWQSPRTRKQARPNVTTPTARAAGIAELEIVVDSRERYAYRFGGQRVATVRRALPCGDYGLVTDGRLIASVERKSLTDLVASLTGGKLRYALAELAALPRAAVVVEDRYSQVFRLERVRPGRRRSRRTPGPLAQRSRRVLRDPPARRGMDLPVPGRRPGMGRHRDRVGRAARTTGRGTRLDRARRRAGRPRALHRGSPGLGAGRRPGRRRRRQAPARDLGRLARGTPRLRTLGTMAGPCGLSAGSRQSH